MCECASPSGKYRRLRVIDPCEEATIYRCPYWPDYMHYHPSPYVGHHDGYLYRPSSLVGHYIDYPEESSSDGAWTQSVPPKNHDVLLPASLEGRYKLFFPAFSEMGRPLNWTYRHWEDLPGHYVGHDTYSDQCGYGTVHLKPHQVPRLHRVVGYKEPAYLPAYGLHPVDGGHAAPLSTASPPQVAATTPLPERELKHQGPPSATRTEQGNTWTVFHCNDDLGSHTIICIGDTMVEARPQTTVQVEQTTIDQWFSKATHQRATALGKGEEPFSHCYLAYSEAVPKTHVLVGTHSIHIDGAVALRFTRSTPGRPVEKC